MGPLKVFAFILNKDFGRWRTEENFVYPNVIAMRQTAIDRAAQKSQNIEVFVRYQPKLSYHIFKTRKRARWHVVLFLFL